MMADPQAQGSGKRHGRSLVVAKNISGCAPPVTDRARWAVMLGIWYLDLTRAHEGARLVVEEAQVD